MTKSGKMVFVAALMMSAWAAQAAEWRVSAPEGAVMSEASASVRGAGEATSSGNGAVKAEISAEGGQTMSLEASGALDQDLPIAVELNGAMAEGTARLSRAEGCEQPSCPVRLRATVRGPLGEAVDVYVDRI